MPPFFFEDYQGLPKSRIFTELSLSKGIRVDTAFNFFQFSWQHHSGFILVHSTMFQGDEVQVLVVILLPSWRGLQDCLQESLKRFPLDFTSSDLSRFRVSKEISLGMSQELLRWFLKALSVL